MLCCKCNQEREPGKRGDATLLNMCQACVENTFSGNLAQP